MSDSRRQDIIDKLDTTLKAITSFAGHVYGWKLDPTDLVVNKQLPCICYKDIGEDITPSAICPSHGKQKHDLKMEFLILAQGADSDKTARELLKLFYAAIGTDQTLSGLCDWAKDISDEMQVEQDSKTDAAILVKMTFEYQTVSFTY
jgi:hypothetical protein